MSREKKLQYNFLDAHIWVCWEFLCIFIFIVVVNLPKWVLYETTIRLSGKWKCCSADEIALPWRKCMNSYGFFKEMKTNYGIEFWIESLCFCYQATRTLFSSKCKAKYTCLLTNMNFHVLHFGAFCHWRAWITAQP